MALDLTGGTSAFHVLIEVALTGGTVYYADQHMVLDNGTEYEGRIQSMSTLRRSAGALLDPRFGKPSLEITLQDADSVVRTSTDSEEWGNKAVTVKLGNGTTAADFDTIYTGVVRFPGGVSYWDDTVLRFSIDDLRSKDSKVLPANRFNPATYANMESKQAYTSIPLVYGDWRTTAGGGETLPCYQIDSTVSTGGKFKIADHALKEIEVVYLNGADITGNCTLDAANGEFSITSTSTYDTLTDVVTANVQGATDDGLTSGTLLQSLPDILDDLLQTQMSIAAGAIDAAAFAAWENELSAAEYGRRWIGTEISSDDLVRDLLVDGFADLTVASGKYTPVYRAVSASTGAATFDGSDILERSDATKDFSVQRDPERIFTNEVVGDYRFAPTESAFKVTYAKRDSASIANLGTTKRRRLAMRWLYVTTGAETRVNRESYLFSTEPEVITMSMAPAAMTMSPTDQFLLSYSKYDSTPMQVRQISVDFLRARALAVCWNMLRLTPGRWTGSSAPAWGSATALQKQEQGFFTDANGRANTGDANSTGSIWF
jgi:hypothetical protein